MRYWLFYAHPREDRLCRRFIGEFDGLAAALERARNLPGPWWHLVDADTGIKVAGQ